MQPEQLSAIVSLALALRVTHIVECGRMGGLPLVHYAHFGFSVTSVELRPQPRVAAALAALAPSVRLIDGDCVALIPQLLDALEPTSRPAIVFDGPKGNTVYRLANALAQRAAFIAVDDQAPQALRGRGNEDVDLPRWPFLNLAGHAWQRLLPSQRVAAALNAEEARTPRPSGKRKAPIAFIRKSGLHNAWHHSGKETNTMLMLGGRWRP
jgi:hypothetical protein